jgi:tRNA-Thr(GGU) m(6)t(6)A37 methyltransferase TsaA
VWIKEANMRRRSEIRPIGKIVSMFRNPEELHFACEGGLHTDTDSEIMLRKDLAPALEGLEGFSHIWVIYKLCKAERVEIKTHPGPPSIKDLPKVGVFASRSQYRPNHIALRLVELVEVNGNSLKVRGLDAINNSSVLDIKPYIPQFDRPDKPRVADWYGRWMK